MTFNGHVKGVGTLDHVVINGTYSPGFSPNHVSVGSIRFSDAGGLLLEIGGLAAGTDHDKLSVLGDLALAGVLEVVLINGFQPALDVGR